MSRIVPAAILEALSLPEISPFYAVELSFDSATLRYWTGYGERTIDDGLYYGAGNLLSISGLDEVGDMSAKTLSIYMNGIPSELIALALTEPYQRRPARVLFGVTDSNDYVEIFSGVMNTMNVEDSGETSRIELAIESKLLELERSRNRRYTHESQQSRYSGDTFFSYVTDLQDREVVWGRTQA